MAAAQGLPCTWLKNGPEFHAACCEVNRLHVPAHSPALLVLTFSVPQTAGQSCGNAERAHSPKCDGSAVTSTAYILCSGMVDLSIWIVISRILVWFAMGRGHGARATRHMGVTRILGDVTHTLSDTRHAVLRSSLKLIFFCTSVCRCTKSRADFKYSGAEDWDKAVSLEILACSTQQK